jgi:hypothetical protein
MQFVLAPLAVALGALGALACGVHRDATYVFVKDPHQVWVEAWTSAGERVLLPAGRQFAGITVHADIPPRPATPTYASVFREPQGGITIDHPSCAPWPTNPLSSQGTLTVVRPHGEPGFSEDAHNLRVPFRCGVGRFIVLELSFVTPLENVKEVHVIEDAEELPIARGSSEPALQAHPWELSKGAF